jgi:hypothetical protein
VFPTSNLNLFTLSIWDSDSLNFAINWWIVWLRITWINRRILWWSITRLRYLSIPPTKWFDSRRHLLSRFASFNLTRIYELFCDINFNLYDWLGAIPPPLIIMGSSVLCPYYHVDKDRFPYHHFIEYKLSMSNAFHVPTSLSIHIPLGGSYGFADFAVPVTLQGFSYRSILLTLICHTCVCANISVSSEIPPYIRNFVSSVYYILTMDIF